MSHSSDSDKDRRHLFVDAVFKTVNDPIGLQNELTKLGRITEENYQSFKQDVLSHNHGFDIAQIEMIGKNYVDGDVNLPDVKQYDAKAIAHMIAIAIMAMDDQDAPVSEPKAEMQEVVTPVGISSDDIVVTSGGAEYAVAPVAEVAGGSASGGALVGDETEQKRLIDRLDVLANGVMKLSEKFRKDISGQNVDRLGPEIHDFMVNTKSIFNRTRENLIDLVTIDVRFDEPGQSRAYMSNLIDTAVASAPSTGPSVVRTYVQNVKDGLIKMKSTVSAISKLAAKRTKQLAETGRVGKESFKYQRRYAARLATTFEDTLQLLQYVSNVVSTVRRTGLEKYRGRSVKDQKDQSSNVVTRLKDQSKEAEQNLKLRMSSPDVRKLVKMCYDKKRQIIDFAHAIDVGLIENFNMVKTLSADPVALSEAITGRRKTYERYAQGTVGEFAKVVMNYYYGLTHCIVIARGDFGSAPLNTLIDDAGVVTFDLPDGFADGGVRLYDNVGGPAVQRAGNLDVDGTLLFLNFRDAGGNAVPRFVFCPITHSLRQPRNSQRDANGQWLGEPAYSTDPENTYFIENNVPVVLIKGPPQDPILTIPVVPITYDLTAAKAKRILKISSDTIEPQALFLSVLQPLEIVDAMFDYLGVNLGTSPESGDKLTAVELVIQMFNLLLSGGMHEFHAVSENVIRLTTPFNYQYSPDTISDFLWSAINIKRTLDDQKIFFARTPNPMTPENSVSTPMTVQIVKDTIGAIFGLAWAIIDRINTSYGETADAAMGFEFMLTGGASYRTYSEPPMVNPDFFETYITAAAVLRTLLLVYMSELDVTEGGEFRKRKRYASLRIPDGNPIKPLFDPLITSLEGRQGNVAGTNFSDITFSTEATIELVAFVNSICANISDSEKRTTTVVSIICNAANELAAFGESVKYIGEISDIAQATSRNVAKIASFVPASSTEFKSKWIGQDSLEIYDGFMTQVALMVQSITQSLEDRFGQVGQRVKVVDIERAYDKYIKKNHSMIMKESPVARGGLLRSILNGQTTVSVSEISMITLYVETVELALKKVAFYRGLVSSMQSVPSYQNNQLVADATFKTSLPILYTDPLNTLRVQKDGDQLRVNIDEVTDLLSREKNKLVDILNSTSDYIGKSELMTPQNAAAFAAQLDTFKQQIANLQIGETTFSVPPGVYEQISINGNASLREFYVGVLAPQTVRDKIVPNAFVIRPIIPETNGDRILLNFIKSTFTNTKRIKIGKYDTLILDIPVDIHRLIMQQLSSVQGVGQLIDERVDNIPLVLFPRQYTDLTYGDTAAVTTRANYANLTTEYLDALSPLVSARRIVQSVPSPDEYAGPSSPAIQEKINQAIAFSELILEIDRRIIDDELTSDEAISDMFLKIGVADPQKTLDQIRQDGSLLTAGEATSVRNFIDLLSARKWTTSATIDSNRKSESPIVPLPASDFWSNYLDYIYANAKSIQDAKIGAIGQSPDGSIAQLNSTLRYASLMQGYGHLGTTVANMFPQKNIYPRAGPILTLGQELITWAVNKLKSEFSIDTAKFLEAAPGAMDSFLTQDGLDYAQKGIMLSMADVFLVGGRSDVFKRIAAVDSSMLFTRIYTTTLSGHGSVAHPSLETVPSLKYLSAKTPRFGIDPVILNDHVRSVMLAMCEGAIHLVAHGPTELARRTYAGISGMFNQQTFDNFRGALTVSSYLTNSARLMSSSYRGNPLTVIGNQTLGEITGQQGPAMGTSFVEYVINTAFGADAFDKFVGVSDGRLENNPTALVIAANKTMFISLSTLVGRIPFAYSKLYTKYGILSMMSNMSFYADPDRFDERLNGALEWAASIGALPSFPAGSLAGFVSIMVDELRRRFRTFTTLQSTQPNRVYAYEIIGQA